MAYVVQFASGQVRLFESRAAALAYESAGHHDVGSGIVDALEVEGEAHYRGRIPVKGVAFGPSDMSHGQLLAAMHNS